MTTTIQDQSKIVDKIKRLFKLSASPNENEAMQAASKAQELLLQYNLSMSDVYKEGFFDKITEHEVEVFKNIPVWKRALMLGVSNSNMCAPIIRSKKVDDRILRRVVFVGRPENTVVAELLYDYLKNEVERLSKLTKDTSLAYQTSFKLGCAQRVCQRLIENFENHKKYGIKSETSPDNNVSALVVSAMYQQNDVEIQLYIENGNIKKGKKRKVKIRNHTAATAYCEGMEAGDKISLNKQIKA
jgi:hypothetical protein